MHVDVQLLRGAHLDTVTQAETLAPVRRRDRPRLPALHRRHRDARDRRAAHRGARAGAAAVPAARRRRCARWPAASTTPGLVLDAYLLRSLAVAGWAPSFARLRALRRARAAPGVHRRGRRRGLPVVPPARLGRARARDPRAARRLLAGDWAVADASDAAAPPRGQRPGRRLPAVAPRARAALAARSSSAVSLTTSPTSPPFPHPSGAPAARRCPPTWCPGTSRSSWTATAAGPTPRGLPRTEGHEARRGRRCSTSSRARSRSASSHLSAYAFSTENWKRSPDEVRFLMGFNRDVIRRRRDEMHELGVRVRWAGRRAAAVASVSRSSRSPRS